MKLRLDSFKKMPEMIGLVASIRPVNEKASFNIYARKLPDINRKTICMKICFTYLVLIV